MTLCTTDGTRQDRDSSEELLTPSGIRVARTRSHGTDATAVRRFLEDALDEQRGLLLFDGPDSLTGYVDPPVEVTVRNATLEVRALNGRGRVLLPPLHTALTGVLGTTHRDGDTVSFIPGSGPDSFPEELRTRQVGTFAALRALLNAVSLPTEPLLGLFGAFGYDLAFQLDPVEPCHQRDPHDRDLVLHLPDVIYELDLARNRTIRHDYEFRVGNATTAWFPASTPARPFVPGRPAHPRDHQPGEYAGLVRRAMPHFRSGGLFEVVPSQVFHRPCTQPPSELFRRLYRHNPAPHSLLMNLGDGEYLVGASPEMFVRVHPAKTAEPDTTAADAMLPPSLLVESSPISGTIARGRDALEDAQRVRTLLDSSKDEHELTMCTDVDRNDKSRVCEAGTVRITQRRRIETYTALIHTVDRVEGLLREGMDALDAFLAHLWAVTVTGAPKLAAMDFIEQHERTPRRWYGGAVGRLGCDGRLDSVLTLRTIHIRDGVASVRAGATLLYDSEPAAEERETELKAKALLTVLEPAPNPAGTRAATAQLRERPGAGLRVLLVDHRDSFVHSLGGYLRRTGAEVETYRCGAHLDPLRDGKPDLVVLSPGPGIPSDFSVEKTIAEAQRLGAAVFGVCLGMQGIIEYAGGRLARLPEPVHGKPSSVIRLDDDSDSLLLRGLPRNFVTGRYHSLYASPAEVPASELRVTAVTADRTAVMAVECPERRLGGVQFHPESLMSLQDQAGYRIITNAVTRLVRPARSNGR